MPKGVIRISTEMFMQLLHLDGYKVKAARFCTFAGTVIEMIVEHEDIPEAKGYSLPEVAVIYKSPSEIKQEAIYEYFKILNPNISIYINGVLKTHAGGDAVCRSTRIT